MDELCGRRRILARPISGQRHAVHHVVAEAVIVVAIKIGGMSTRASWQS
jgi:hypothetical protein